jgi:hypothetical protein
MNQKGRSYISLKSNSWILNPDTCNPLLLPGLCVGTGFIKKLDNPILKFMNRFISALLLFITPCVLPASTQPDTYAADVESVDAILSALYATISGPAHQERDWDRFRALFAPGAQLIPIRVTPDTTQAVFTSVDDYIERANPYFLQNGFFEIEVARKTEDFGHILHAFSTYESRNKADDPEPFARGINSIQLLNDGNRWWVVNIMWDSERPGQAIPSKYLPD